MSVKRVLVLVHQDLIPPGEKKESEFNREVVPWITEYDVITHLKKSDYQIETLGVYSDLKVIREKIEEFKPHIVFNLLEEFDGEALFDQNVVSYLELLRVPYTGCNPRGLILGRDKSVAKKILRYHRIKSPKFFVFPKNRKMKKPKQLGFPLIVKCLTEEASYGISQASVVHNEEKLYERIEYVNRKLEADAIVEEFIEGKEYCIGVYGNYRLKTLPVMELHFENVDSPEKEIYSHRAKWNESYRLRKGIVSRPAQIDPMLATKIAEVGKRTYRALNLSGYARVDLRVDGDGEIFVIEANPNPNIGRTDEFAMSALKEKISYKSLLKKLIDLGISWHRGG